MIIGTRIVPAVLKPSKKLYTIDGETKYFEKLRLIPKTVIFMRGFNGEKLKKMRENIKKYLSSEEYSLLLEDGGFLPCTI